MIHFYFHKIKSKLILNSDVMKVSQRKNHLSYTSDMASANWILHAFG